MKKIKISFVACSIAINITGQTNFQGGIYTDTEWVTENSPYIITGDVVIFPGKKLTIQPGVSVKVDSNYFLEIRGELYSVGTNTARIIYTSNDSTPQKGDWMGIILRNYQGAKASFEYCDFSYANYAHNIECCEPRLEYFKNCTFDNNIYASAGLSAYEVLFDSCVFTNNTYCITSTFKIVRNSKFIGNEYGLYDASCDVSHSIFSENYVAVFGKREHGLGRYWGNIVNCIITNNQIGIMSGSTNPEIKNCDIFGNNIGIQIRALSAPIINNNICHNIEYNVELLDDTEADLSQNCWCEDDSTKIAEKILDGYDDIHLGLVQFSLDYSSCGIYGGVRLKANAGNDTAFCAIDRKKSKLGGNPTAKGGAPPYSYSWSCIVKQGDHRFYASTFLNDTSVANPFFEDHYDSLMFYLELTDDLGYTAVDSVFVRFSEYISCLGECREYINKGDSVKLYHCVYGGISPYSYNWTPEVSLSDPHSETPWAKPNENTSYSLIIIDSVGCKISSECEVIVTPDGVYENLSSDNSIRIISNAAEAKLNVIISQSLLNNSRFEIISLDGKILKMWKITERSSMLDYSGLIQGVYLYRLICNEDYIEQGKFLIK